MSSLILFFAISCTGNCNKYQVGNYYSDDLIDTLLVNLVTYIGKKPVYTNHETRHLPEHREFYTNQSALFSFRHYYISDDSTHFFYLIRPARSPSGIHRGVGGKFRMTESLKITEIEELFNTPVMHEEELIVVGEKLFREMIAAGNVDKYIDNKSYVEWPDERLRYDKDRNEWRYDVAD